MPKTRKKFDWEIYENGNCIDILSMNRSEAKEYQLRFPNYILKEIGYTDILNKELDD